eukprot:XP_001704809.1 Hypothetical protein GL50803_32451 [Giardia lamblia ATCC 50803]
MLAILQSNLVRLAALRDNVRRRDELDGVAERRAKADLGEEVDGLVLELDALLLSSHH